jgi:putative transposase
VKPYVKYLAIYHHRNEYPVTIMCAFFDVSRSGYYGHIDHIDKPDRDEPLAQMIAECQEHCGKTYGCRRIQIWLKKYKNLSLNLKTVLRVMNKYGLLSDIRRRRKYRHMGEQLHKYENLLNREFKADKPNQKWVTDISYIHTTQGVLYLSMIHDLYDTASLHTKQVQNKRSTLYLTRLKQPYKKKWSPQSYSSTVTKGFNTLHRGYFDLTKDYGIMPSMSRRGNCYDNAMAENFFGILKTECIYRHKLKSFDEARQMIDDYIYFYNNERIQLKTKLMPLEKRRQLV